MEAKKPSPIHRSLIDLLILSLPLGPTAHAIGPMPDKNALMAQFGQEISGMGGGVSEYSYRGDKDDVLVPVYILGSVNRPGLYHVPLKSELVTVLSIAGGLGSEANYDRVMLKDTRTGKTQKISMDDIVSEGKQKSHPLLGSEIIFIDKSTPWISNNTMLVIGFVTGVLSIALASKALQK